ncbi:MAG: Nucleic acid binding, OB-fold, tRNA/helicase-type [Parcubacteria group bacterium Gr01-1014_3]|nr:MAG: Nucleic acid binding, OB-fold, tRNA/helicase-type [Parcubacteria group bacterium Gr01-1014_3]
MIIQEFLPNPVGKDTDGEYILLFNDSAGAVSLDGWSLKDASGKIFKLSGKLTANQPLKLNYATTKISLNNSEETIYLIDPAGKEIDRLTSGNLSEGFPAQHDVDLNSGTYSGIFEKLSPISAGPLAKNEATASVFIFWILSAMILASLAVYILKNVYDQESGTN